MLGKRKHRSYYTKEGYKQIYTPSSPEARANGYAPEHRVVASEKLGRPLYDHEVVHHRDGNKRNNRPSNLQVMSRSQHARIHKYKRRRNGR
ncbi:MAG: HNH endonuclease [Clostridiales bacterium]|nr:HNH endonuclease [Clostridiales bacterium]